MRVEWIKFNDKLGPMMEEGWTYRGPEMRAEYHRSWEAWQGIDLPPERKLVLLQIAPKEKEGLRAAVAVGYLRYAAGDIDCPYFVIPGIGGQVTAYADCLPEDFSPQCWNFPVPNREELDRHDHATVKGIGGHAYVEGDLIILRKSQEPKHSDHEIAVSRHTLEALARILHRANPTFRHNDGLTPTQGTTNMDPISTPGGPIDGEAVLQEAILEIPALRVQVATLNQTVAALNAAAAQNGTIAFDAAEMQALNQQIGNLNAVLGTPIQPVPNSAPIPPVSSPSTTPVVTFTPSSSTTTDGSASTGGSSVPPVTTTGSPDSSASSTTVPDGSTSSPASTPAGSASTDTPTTNPTPAATASPAGGSTDSTTAPAPTDTTSTPAATTASNANGN